ncbi:MAG: CaiB/BaiF CoA transferase family protein [Pseudomonadales bacterium]
MNTPKSHDSQATTQPLVGVSVLEFSHTIMGPCAGMILADLGANVVKVEPAPGGDKTRQLRGFAAGFFATFNRNKRSLVIDLKQERGQEAMHKLVETVDIVLDNYGPGTMEKLGCGYEQLAGLNNKLIYLSLKGYLAGPLEDRPALDEVVQFQSGLAYMTGPPGKPLRAGASIVDILGATFGVIGLLAALRERDVTNKGQRVGSALFESAAFLMASHMTGAATTGETVPPMTARKGAWAIYDVFESSDELQIFIGVTSDAQWKRFCDEFDLQNLLADKRLQTNPERTGERHWLLPKIAQVVAAYDYANLIVRCEAADVSWSPVGQPEQLWDDKQLLAGGLLDTSLATSEQAASDFIRDSLIGIPGLPLEFGVKRSRCDLRRQPPHTGEHSREVLLDAGIEHSVIESLLADNVIASFD